MHPATSAHICGMIEIVRQALNSIEAAIVAEKGGYSNTLKNSKERQDNAADGNETHYLDDVAEDALGKLMEQHLKEAVKNDNEQ